MNKTMMLGLGVLMCASLMCVSRASAQGGHIGLYPDIGYSQCNLVENVGAENVVYIVQDVGFEGKASQFKVDVNWPTATDLGVDWGDNLTLGDITTGVAVSYPGCKPLPYLLGTWAWFSESAAPPCTSSLSVVPDPNETIFGGTAIVVVDCGSNVWMAAGGDLAVNADENCHCLWDPIANEETSWSRVKALYR
jgi:hypothetical protein